MYERLPLIQKGIGYDDEVFYESEKDSVARRENESTLSRYSRIVTQQVNVLINVPVLKHHAMAGVSGCFKESRVRECR